jgi:hypothetical protein
MPVSSIHEFARRFRFDSAIRLIRVIRGQQFRAQSGEMSGILSILFDLSLGTSVGFGQKLLFALTEHLKMGQGRAKQLGNS